MRDSTGRLETYINDIRPRYETMLGQAVEIPSISMDPQHAPDIRRMAEVAAQYLRDAGAEAQVVETPGYPVVKDPDVEDGARVAVEATVQAPSHGGYALSFKGGKIAMDQEGIVQAIANRITPLVE